MNQWNVTDLHSHVLPGVDDGSASVEESLDMLRMEAEQGIGRVVATPHFYPDRDTPERFLQRRDRAERQLREKMAEQSGLPLLTVGAEVYYFRGMSRSDALDVLTVRGTDCLLVELPPAPWPEEVYRELEEIRRLRGIVPIVAHVDRYIRPLHTRGIPRRLAELPVLVQANAGFFTRPATAPLAFRMLRAGQIHLLGSDCHGRDERRPDLGPALERIQRRAGAEALDQIRILEGQLLNCLCFSGTEGQL